MFAFSAVVWSFSMNRAEAIEAAAKAGAKTQTMGDHLLRVSGVLLVVCAAFVLCLSCGGVGSAPSPTTPATPPPQAVPLSMSDVNTIVQSAVNSVNAPMVVAVADRAGNILAVFKTSQ